MAYWVILVIISVGLSLAAFIWGLRSGQFADPERARYLAISERSLAPPVAEPGRITREVYLLWLIAAMVLAILATTVVLSVCRAGG
jgi:cbb3-type cytochrome oxidase maturation protein